MYAYSAKIRKLNNLKLWDRKPNDLTRIVKISSGLDSLKIAKVSSAAVNRRPANIIIVKSKITNHDQQKLHRKLQIKQYERHKKSGELGIVCIPILH